MCYSEGDATLQYAYRTRICHATFEIFIACSVVGTGIVSNNIVSSHPNVTCHSRGWPYAVTQSTD